MLIFFSALADGSHTYIRIIKISLRVIFMITPIFIDYEFIILELTIGMSGLERQVSTKKAGLEEDRLVVEGCV